MQAEKLPLMHSMVLRQLAGLPSECWYKVLNISGEEQGNSYR